jgi:hypothetical protein
MPATAKANRYAGLERVLDDALAAGRRPDAKAVGREIVHAGLDRPVRLHDGTLGYRPLDGRPDDCWRAAAATVLKVNPRQMPDAQLDARRSTGANPEQVSASAWGAFLQWLYVSSLRMEVHAAELPVWLPRWVGVVCRPGQFKDHCLVMNGANVLWNPTDLTPSPFAFLQPTYTINDVGLGYSFTLG